MGSWSQRSRPRTAERQLLGADAALLDPVLAEQRAEQTSATDFKPLFLIRVAVGEEMKQPWWNR